MEFTENMIMRNRKFVFCAVASVAALVAILLGFAINLEKNRLTAGQIDAKIVSIVNNSEYRLRLINWAKNTIADQDSGKIGFWSESSLFDGLQNPKKFNISSPEGLSRYQVHKGDNSISYGSLKYLGTSIASTLPDFFEDGVRDDKILLNIRVISSDGSIVVYVNRAGFIYRNYNVKINPIIYSGIDTIFERDGLSVFIPKK